MANVIHSLGILVISFILTACGGANYAPVRDAIPANENSPAQIQTIPENNSAPPVIYSEVNNTSGFNTAYTEPVIVETVTTSEPTYESISEPEQTPPPVVYSQTTETPPPVIEKTPPPAPAPVIAPAISPDAGKSKWIWPSAGKVLRGFSTQNKGLDIQGNRGDPVYASAEGKVVYSGTGLRGYGQLVIIKHNADYVTAYAHNSAVLVEEGDSVKQGQKIAEIGDSGTDSVKLYFELRYKGKPVNPITYLPKR